MSETRDPNELMGAAQDIAPLAWVINEIRTSLGDAVASVKAFLGAKQDLDRLRHARSNVHQANGALQLLDLRGVALVVDAIEQLLRRWESHPADCLPASVRVVETAIAAVLAYLDGLLSGRPNQPVRLFPYYRDVLQLSRAARAHPADLIFPDLSRRPAFHTIEVKALTPDQLRVRRVRYEEGLLGFLRDSENPRARRLMREALADLEHLPQRGLARSFWWIVRGLTEALDAHAVPVDIDLKRVLARLNLQLRRLIEGGSAVAERLMIDALYYVGRAEEKVPRVIEVRRLYGLEALLPPDFERPTLTAVDADALRELKESIGQAKNLWAQIVNGINADPARLAQELGNARAAAVKIEAADGNAPIGRALATVGAASEGFAALEPRIREALGLEVASALLFLEIGADELPQLDPQYTTRAAAVAARLQAARRGNPLPDSAPWLSELARRAQDRITMGSVVTETQATLREIEQRLDRFFRNPAERSELAATGPMFDQICGVLAVLGFEEPVAALRNVQQSVRNFAEPNSKARPEEFARIAQNLGAIGFFVETLGQDTERPRGMFHYDPTSGVFSADLGQIQGAETVSPPDDELVAAPRTIDLTIGEIALASRATAENVETSAEQHQIAVHKLARRLADRPADSALTLELGGVLAALMGEADLLDDAHLKGKAARAGQFLARFRDTHNADLLRALSALFAPAAAAVVPKPTAPMPASQAAADRELHDIFVEEANEVLVGIGEQLLALRAAPDDQATLITVRRAFHTLKGSSRMVGLKSFGEAAWGVEQCFNLWLAQERVATEDLIALADAAGLLMVDWIATINSDPRRAIDVGPLVRAAQRVREGGAFEYEGELPGSGALDPPKSWGSAADLVPPALPEDLDGGATETIELSAAELDWGDGLEAPGLQLPAHVPTLAASDGANAAEQPEDAGEEEVRRIGPIAISHGLYSVFLNEADECIRVLGQDIAEWRFEPARNVLAATVRRAHSLAGISSTIGLAPVHQIADPLDDLMHELSGREGPFATSTRPALELSPQQFDTLERVIERLRGMLHQFAAGLYPDDAPLEAGAVLDLLSVVRAHGALAHAAVESGAPILTAVPTTPAMPVEEILIAAATDLETEPSHTADVDAVPTSTALSPTHFSSPGAETGDPLLADIDALPAAEIAQEQTQGQEQTQEQEQLHESGLESEYVPAPTSVPAGAPPAPIGAVATPFTAEDPGFNPTLMDGVTDAVADDIFVAHSAGASRPRIDFAPPLIAPITSNLAATAPDGIGTGADVDSSAAAEVVLSRVRDELDPDLLGVFLTEAHDLLPAIAANLRRLAASPHEPEIARDLMRQFHTVKGSARMAGAMRLGELVHDMETRIESAMQLAIVPPMIVEDLQSQYDRAMSLFDDLQHPQAIEISRNAAAAEEARERGESAAVSAAVTPAPSASGAPLAPVIELAAARKEAARAEAGVPQLRSVAPSVTAPPASYIRVRADVLDKLVDQAGEVAISRSRLENEVGTLKGSLSDLTENIGRLRTQLREVEIQADAQIAARSEKVNKSSSDFDPLEFDRYSRLQELTRLLVESVEDVAMVQSNMLKGLSLADTDLTAQSRLTRELQQQLMRVRLVPFANIGERLYRVARQAAKELDKRVALEIRGGTAEIDRGVLERMGGPFEHLVRNAIVHGLETPAERRAAGKSDTGELTIDVRQEGNELVVVVGDNGAGLNLPRIRSRAAEKGLITPDQSVSERELTELIFAPGFSTATEVTELAGRGVGMDVVRAELSSFGGRIAVTSEAGVGTRFTLYLPLTLAVTQVVLATVGARRYAIPAAMVEQVRRFKPAALAPALASGTIDFAPLGSIVLRTLAQLLGEDAPLHHTRQVPVVLLRSGDDRLAIALDDMSSNQEVVVKSVGMQVSRLAGVLGATILGNGEIVLIINPVQYIARASEPSPALASVPLSAAEARRSPEAGIAAGAPAVIMVVDDSLTVRRVTQRFLERNGFDVMLAKDGVDALRQLQDASPDVMLVDIEMPRMDGYDLTRNVRASSDTRAIPIIMITSRTAEKHRNMAFDLGVNEYLGKPYQEDELLGMIRKHLALSVSA